MVDIEKHMRKETIAKGKDLAKESFPLLYNLSPAFVYRFVLTAKAYVNPEFLYLPLPSTIREKDAELFLRVSQWNMQWEAGHLRHEFFERKEIKQWQHLLNRLKGHNIYLLSGDPKLKYNVYSPLYHLLSAKTLQRFGLPTFKRALWPFNGIAYLENNYLPKDFVSVLSQAFAYHVWPLINSGSPLKAFSRTDSLYLLAHNLDYWLPYVYQVCENRLRLNARVACEDKEQMKLLEEGRKKMPSDAEINRPLRGGPIWEGEEDAWIATQEMVNLADQKGQLRSIIDAIRSHRVKDDFSSRWSHAKEDFERKLYRKRAKVKVSFVELDETIPVHGPESEVHENVLWQDFLGLLDVKEKQIVVCLRNGVTKLAEVAKEVGYATHSPISKALNRIRGKALKFLM